MGEANYPLGRKPDPRRVLAALRELATGGLVHGMTAAVCKDMADELEAFLTAPAEARSEQPVDPDAPTPRTDGRQPPAGYVKLPAGERCKCVALWQQAIGELWCCKGAAIDHV